MAFHAVYSFLDRCLGLHVPAANMDLQHMALRAFVVFCFGLILVRLGDRRLLAANSGFDVLMWVILGSVLSRGVNGQAAFFPTLGGSAVIVLLHHLLCTASFRWHWFSDLVKGRAFVLVRNGKADEKQMRKTKFTIDDLDENLRLNGNVAEPEKVQEARLERNGSVSVVCKPHGK